VAARTRSTATSRPAARTRLDHLCVAQGLAPSRHQAEAAIRAGEVYVDGGRVDKPGTLIAAGATIERRARGPAFVSRGGTKLAGALDALGVDPSGQVVLDVGASTGGFTDCLLQRGARRVYAVDVGRGLLHWRLRGDPRVVVMEGRHGARLTPDELPEPVGLATVDCSFISILKVLPAVARLLRSGGTVVALVKPQFEAGPKAAPRGVVRDPAVHETVLRRVVAETPPMGLRPGRVSASVLTGPEGNREFFVLLRKEAGAPADTLDEEIRREVHDGRGDAG
jgi:23S rRNA (cytidine1920-2'-O)/16S rRNA (cytidine1409-2'-O)-methyltransferase